MTHYQYIAEYPGREPLIKGTRITVSRIVRELDFGRDREHLDNIVEMFDGRIKKEAISEALKYYDDHRSQIDRYITESIRKSGKILFTNNGN